MVKVKLIKTTGMLLNGNITGRTYAFRNINEPIWVDKRDALSMKEINGLQVLY